MASINVYVPDSLKAQMDAMPDLKWSGIAQAAFRASVAQERTTGLDADAIAARLKGTAGENGSAFQEGVKEGQAWAARVADVDDLSVLAATDLEALLREFPCGLDAANHLANALGTGEDASFFFGSDGQPAPTAAVPSPITAARLRGFVAGALGVYEQVRDKISA